MSIKLKDQNNNEIFIAGTNSEDFINDKVLRNDKTWSSNKIVEELYPTFQKEGNPIICYPVENYPLNVKATFSPKQAGSGDPSPENVRPISGYDSVTVTGCGKNLLDFDQLTAGFIAYGLTSEKIEDDTIRVSGTATQSGDGLSFVVVNSAQTELQGKGFSVFPIPLSDYDQPISAYGLRTVGESAIAIVANLTNGENYDMRFKLMITADNSTPTAYEPYQGSTTTLTLPETIYGGTVDAVTGVGDNTYIFKELAISDMDNAENFPGWNNQEWVAQAIPGEITDSTLKNLGCEGIINVYPTLNFRITPSFDLYLTSNNVIFPGLTQSQIKEQYPDLVVQFCLKLVAPEPFQATGNQPLPAVAGLNTVYTDGDSLIISGKEDIKYTINQITSNIQDINQIQEINNILLGVE